jgi:two-component system phosphate regulon response regulator OmpR
MSQMDAHLLIVDDDERIRTLLQKFLIRHGFLVTAARDAAHARRILSGLEFDMIVLDVMIPARNHANAHPVADRQRRDRQPHRGAGSRGG